MLYKQAEVRSLWFGQAGQVLAALTSLFLLLCFIFYNKRQSLGKCPLPPGPRGLPLVGYLPFLGSDLRLTFKELADLYGPIFRVRLGTKQGIVITSPSLAKEVLRDQDVIFANRDPTVAARVGLFGASEIAFSDNGPEWRKMKKIFATEMMSNARNDASYYLRKEQVKKMISRTYSRAGELVDTGELTYLTIISSFMSMIWGDTLKGQERDSVSIGAKFRPLTAEFMILLGAPNISDYLPYLARFDFQGIKGKMKLVADELDRLFDLAIEHHNATDSDSRKDFLGYLLQRTKREDPATSLTLPQIKGILVDTFVGGMDTTATTVEWAMSHLLNQPEMLITAQEELTKTVGLDNTVEEADLPKLKYLNAVLKETLRLHSPVALLIPHRSNMVTTVGGYTIPKDSQIFINTWAIHRDPQLWEGPTEFRPERFMNGSENYDFLGNQPQYLPFGSGRRMCPGMNLAEKMAMFVLASALHSFEWRLPDGAEDVDFSETFGIVVKKSKPTIAIPIPRLSRMELYSCD